MRRRNFLSAVSAFIAAVGIGGASVVASPCDIITVTCPSLDACGKSRDITAELKYGPVSRDKICEFLAWYQDGIWDGWRNDERFRRGFEKACLRASKLDWQVFNVQNSFRCAHSGKSHYHGFWEALARLKDKYPDVVIRVVEAAV